MRKLVMLFILVQISGMLKAAVFMVTSNADAGEGTLREAINQANSNGSAAMDFIYFDLPGNNKSDVTIALQSELPILSNNITIDGTTQSFAALGSLSIKVSLVRVAAEYFNGLRLDNAGYIEIYGLSFNNFKSDPLGAISDKKGGIYLSGSSNIIIGALNKSNCFAGNYAGILSPFVVPRADVFDVKISSNIIGLSEDGLNVIPNETGIDISFLKNSIIGGVLPGEGNLITSNTRNGIALGAADGDIKIINNIVGLDINGILKSSIAANGVYVNGATSRPVIQNNIIGGQFQGILLDYINSGFIITSNYIGTGKSGTQHYGNTTGIHINFSQSGKIGGNTTTEQNLIAYNETAVLIEISYPISILKNSIYCNNASINFKNLPAGKTVTQSKIDVISQNSASGTYLPNAVVELFYDDECPDCQGKNWIATIATDANGSWQYNGPLNGGLTSTGTNQDGATSTFSKPLISDAAIKIADVFCGAANGGISGLAISDASIFNWYNATNELVAASKDLTNVPAGTYYLKASQPGGCDVLSASYTIKNIDVIYKVKTSSVKPATCNEKNGRVSILSYESQTPTIFSWTDERGIVVANTETLDGISPGNYTLTASSDNGCVNVAGVFSVGLTELPLINLTQMQQSISCDGKVISASGIEIIGSTAPYTYNWINAEGSSVNQSLNLEGVKPDKYILQVTDKYGCEVSTESIDFTRLENKVLKVPNSISPNGDGTNDTWKIAGASNYPDAEFFVFNRNGDRIFYSKGYTKEFDGTDNGKPLTVGVYYYLIDLKTDCGKLSGSLTILK